MFVTNGNPLGGAEVQLMRLAARLRRLGDEVQVMALLPNPDLLELLAKEGIPVKNVRMSRPFKGLSAVASGIGILRSGGFDAVIGFDYQSMMLARLSGRIARVPVIISSIRNERFGGRGRELAVRLTDRLGNVTVVNSDLVAGQMRRRAVVPADRLTSIANGIEISGGSGSDVKRDSFGLKGGDFVWLAAGRLQRQKDYPTLLKAMKVALGSCGWFRLLIAGEGPLRQELETLSARLGLTNAVRFVGYRKDLQQLMRLADALVMSSAWEGLPNVILEGQVAGLPVVASMTGGVPELVKEGISGYLVPPNNPEALADVMQRLGRLEPEEREKMGRNGKEHALASYSMECTVQKWSELIDDHLWAAGRPTVA